MCNDSRPGGYPGTLLRRVVAALRSGREIPASLLVEIESWLEEAEKEKTRAGYGGQQK
jgi:hypothetical protein